MRLTLLFMLCAFAISAQTKIDFRDGKSITLNGKQLGTFAKPDFFDPTIVEKNIQSSYKMDGDSLEISEYSIYSNNSFDNLYIYRIHKNQIEIDYLSINEDTNEEGEIVAYSLSFTAVDETKFQYKKYDIYSSLGKPTSFNTFTLTCNQKEGLEELINTLTNN